ncbi:MAG: hypothetical protein P4M11_02925 [Candidatus Pacebacteria bacterium]|nr:hypothetical protein [Candidatus Paceibacterota bacterium]
MDRSVMLMLTVPSSAGIYLSELIYISISNMALSVAGVTFFLVYSGADAPPGTSLADYMSV